MKSILVLIFFQLALFASVLKGDVDKGQTYYQYIIYPMMQMRGDVFTKQHTKKEWETLFNDKGKAFKAKYSSVNSEFKAFLGSQKFTEIAADIKAFCIYYAKDSDIKPQCGD